MRNAFITLALAASLAGPVLAQMPPASPPGGPRGMMRADANGDGVVTRAEATAEADAQFDRMDANHDGKVTGDEMRAAFQAMRGGAGAGRGMAGRFGGGGEVSMSREDMRARALARFDRMDANHDGKVDQAEIDAARQARMNRAGDAQPTGEQ